MKREKEDVCVCVRESVCEASHEVKEEAFITTHTHRRPAATLHKTRTGDGRTSGRSSMHSRRHRCVSVHVSVCKWVCM
jgi:hypothetical protein